MTPATLCHFRQLAERLAAESNVVDLLSAALAVVSGVADIKQRSILSSREVTAAIDLRPDLQNILRQSYDNAIVTIHSASEVTTLWRYTNLFIIIIIITYDRRLIYKISYERHKAFLGYNSLAKS